MTSPLADCLRCGITQMVRHNELIGYVCRDCKTILAREEWGRGLPDGTWVNIAGIRRFVPSGRTRPTGRPRKQPRYTWTLDDARRAHREYVKGNRNDWSLEGERMYSRWAKSRQRASRREAA